MILCKKLFKYLFISILIIGAHSTFAASGTIDATYHGALLCTNDSCTTFSKINFGKFLNTPSANVTVSDTGLSGYIWGENFGWVVLNCSDTVSGCTSLNGNFKVANDGAGHLSGYAWGENTGWINFGPFLNSTTTAVTINSVGQFGGWAWAQNFGWIKFDCTVSDACVVTDWRADVVVPPTPPDNNISYSSSGSTPFGWIKKTSTSVTTVNTPIVVPVSPTVPNVPTTKVPIKKPTTSSTSFGSKPPKSSDAPIIYPTEPTTPPVPPVVINKAPVKSTSPITSDEKKYNNQTNAVSCKTDNIFSWTVCVVISYVSNLFNFIKGLI